MRFPHIEPAESSTSLQQVELLLRPNFKPNTPNMKSESRRVDEDSED